MCEEWGLDKEEGMEAGGRRESITLRWNKNLENFIPSPISQMEGFIPREVKQITGLPWWSLGEHQTVKGGGTGFKLRLLCWLRWWPELIVLFQVKRSSSRVRIFLESPVHVSTSEAFSWPGLFCRCSHLPAGCPSVLSARGLWVSVARVQSGRSRGVPGAAKGVHQCETAPSLLQCSPLSPHISHGYSWTWSLMNSSENLKLPARTSTILCALPRGSDPTQPPSLGCAPCPGLPPAPGTETAVPTVLRGKDWGAGEEEEGPCYTVDIVTS